MADKLMEWIGGIWDTVTDIGSDDKAVNVVPCDLDGGVIGSSDAPSHSVIVDENGPLGTSENPGNVVLRGNDGSIVDLNYVPVKVSGTIDPTFVFANNAAANTQKTVTITKPGSIKKLHRFIFDNPGASDLTVKVFNVKAIGGSTKHFIGSFIVPAAATVTGTSLRTDARNVISDCFLGDSNLELVISNNQLIGAAGGFTGTLQVYGL